MATARGGVARERLKREWMFANDGRRAGHLKTAIGSGSKRPDPVTKKGQSPEIGSRAG